MSQRLMALVGRLSGRASLWPARSRPVGHQVRLTRERTGVSTHDRYAEGIMSRLRGQFGGTRSTTVDPR